MEDKYSEVEKIIRNEIKSNDYAIMDNEYNVKKILNIYRLLNEDDISNVISLLDDIKLKEGVDYEN